MSGFVERQFDSNDVAINVAAWADNGPPLLFIHGTISRSYGRSTYVGHSHPRVLVQRLGLCDPFCAKGTFSPASLSTRPGGIETRLGAVPYQNHARALPAHQRRERPVYRR
jgi:hypothetical protein